VNVAGETVELVVCMADIVETDMTEKESTEVMQKSISIEVLHNVTLMSQQNMTYEMVLCNGILLIHKMQTKVL